MSGLGQRIGDAFVAIVFVALAAVLVAPQSKTGNIIGQGGQAFSAGIKAATLQH